MKFAKYDKLSKILFGVLLTKNNMLKEVFLTKRCQIHPFLEAKWKDCTVFWRFHMLKQ
jgi:hypothetical protein